MELKDLGDEGRQEKKEGEIREEKKGDINA